MTGIRSARQAEEVDRLRTDKRRLVEKLKKEVNIVFTLLKLCRDLRNSHPRYIKNGSEYKYFPNQPNICYV